MLAIKDRNKADDSGEYGIRRKELSEIHFLGEECNVTAVWDIYDKTSIVFGKDDSENGTRLQRAGEGKKYRVSSREPCKVKKNDIIYLGLAPVKIC